MHRHRRLMGIFGLATLALVGCSGEVEPDDDYSNAEDLRDKLDNEGFTCTGGEERGSDAVSRLTCEEGHELAVWEPGILYGPLLEQNQNHLLSESWLVSSESADYLQSARELFGGRYVERLTEDVPTAAEERDQAVENGDVVGPGDYRVGTGIEPGSYVAVSEEGFDGCYWERLDSAGNIITNNFMASGFRAEVLVMESDYSFSSERCGDWVRQ